MKRFTIIVGFSAALVLIMAACAPQEVVVTEVVEREVEVVVTQEVEVEVEVPAEIGELRNVRFTHGGSLCNLALFTSFENAQWWAEEGLSPESVPSPSITEQIAAINLGLVDFAGGPYTSLLASVAQSEGTLAIPTGIGVGGLGLLAHSDTATPEDMPGTTWGLSPSDTLEVLGFQWLNNNGLSYDDINIIYEAAGTDVIASWIGGDIDVVNCTQPFCNDLAATHDGVLLTDGTDIFGDNYSDCLLLTSRNLIENEPEVVAGVIKVLMRSQQQIEQDLDLSITQTFDRWYRVETEDIVRGASEAVHPQIDQRNQIDFIMNGVDFMIELGYIPEDLASEVDSPDKIFDWSIMDQVIADNPELYDSLERK